MKNYQKLAYTLAILLASLNVWGETVSKTVNELAEANNWVIASGSGAQTCYTNFNLDENITISTSGSSNCGSVWGTDTKDWRLYQTQKGDVTITAATGYELVSARFTYSRTNSGTLLDGETVIGSTQSVTLSGNSKTFVVGNTNGLTNGQVRITAFLVEYKVSGTTPTPPDPEDPEEEEYAGTIVRLNATEGADIRFVSAASSSAQNAFWVLCEPKKAKGIELSGSNGSSSSYSYYDGSVVRFYQNNTFTLTPNEGITIEKVEIVRSTSSTSNQGVINCTNLTASEDNTSTNTNVYTGETTSAVTFTAAAQARFTEIKVYYTGTPETSLSNIATIGAPGEFWLGDTFNHNGITIVGTYEDGTTQDVTAAAEFSSPDMSTPGQKVVTVTYKGEQTTYTIEVRTIANTPETAYTANEAKQLIDANKDLATPVFVRGTVSQIITPWSNSSKTITFNISEDGATTGQQFQLYRNQKNATETYSTNPNISIGDDVVGYGTLYYYPDTGIYELNTGNYLVEHLKVAVFGIADMDSYGGETMEPEIETQIEDYTIVYESSDPAIAYIENGELKTGTTPGTATITATMTADGWKTSSKTFLITVRERTAIEMSISGFPDKTEYLVGEAFAHEGLTAIMLYNDGSIEDVTESATWTFAPEVLTTATTTVHVTASSADISTSEEYEISVSRHPAHAVASIAILKRGQLTLTTGTTPEDAELEYSVVSGSEYIRVDDATIYAQNEGEGLIRVRYAGNEEYRESELRLKIKVLHNDTIFYESFDQCNGTGGNDQSWNGSIATGKFNGDNDWDIVRGYGAHQCARFGTTSEAGSATTPTIELTGDAMLTFRAAGWNADKSLNISATSGSLSTTQIALTQGVWTDYTIYLSGVSGSTQITFAAASKNNNQFFLDEVRVIEPGKGTFRIGSSEWATWYTEDAFVMPEGVTGVTVSENISGELTLTEKYPQGTAVPAKTPLLIHGEAGTYEFRHTYPALVGTGATGVNYLRGQLNAGMITAEESGSWYYYKLTTGPKNTEYEGKLGFYFGAVDGGVFEIKNDNRAYLVLPQTALSPVRLLLEDMSVEEGIVTRILPTRSTEKTQKLLIDGHIYILRDNHIYDTTGRIVH